MIYLFSDVPELTIAVQDLKNLREEMEDARVQRAPENPGAQAEVCESS